MFRENLRNDSWILQAHIVIGSHAGNKRAHRPMNRPKPRSSRVPRTIHRRFTHWQLATGRSKIHGTGVFALEDIPARMRVIEYTGERLSLKAAERRARRWEHRGARGPLYLAYANRRWVIDGARGGCGAERINHSCAPNLGYWARRGRLWFVSRRRIAAGEELTLDYALHPEAVRLPCRCGAASCRGTLNRKRIPAPSQSRPLRRRR